MKKKIEKDNLLEKHKNQIMILRYNTITPEFNANVYCSYKDIAELLECLKPN